MGLDGMENEKRGRRGQLREGVRGNGDGSDKYAERRGRRREWTGKV